MTNARTVSVHFLLAALAVSCGPSSPAPGKVERGELPAGVAAAVGDELVSVKLVAEIAAAQQVTPEVACDKAISDALFAEAAKKDLAGRGWVESAESSALARALLVDLRRQAEAQGPPTDDEVQRLTEVHWRELDHPALSKTTHAVVRVKSPADDAKAKEVAQRIAAAVAGVTDPKEFRDRAKKVDSEGLEVRAEDVIPLAPDGRGADPDQKFGEPPPKFDVDYAKAASAIAEVGQQSPVIHTSFGYDVILLTERFPAVSLPLEKRRTWLIPEIVDRRARAALGELANKLNQSTPVRVERSADDSMLHVLVR